jgi:hypothetical protein
MVLYSIKEEGLSPKNWREAFPKTDLYFYKPIANTCDYSMITIFFVALYSLASSL